MTQIKSLYFQHISEGSLIEIFLTIGNVVKELTLKKVRAASCFGLITDVVFLFNTKLLAKMHEAAYLTFQPRSQGFSL